MKLRFHTKLSYGIGGAADNAFYTLFATYQLFFLTTVAGVNPAAAGTISAAGSIFEVFCGPVVGTLSDRTRHRLGKRRPADSAQHHVFLHPGRSAGHAEILLLFLHVPPRVV